MDPTNSLQMGRGRWILTGALLMLTFIGAFAALMVLPPTYQSQSSVVLLASPAASEPNGDNPYLSFSSSLTLTADVVSRIMMSPSVAGYLASNGFPDSYSVALATYTTATTGSVLLVTVTGTDKVGVDLTLHGVTDEIGTVLARLQSGDHPADRVRAVTISMTGASLSLGQLARFLTVLICAGLAVSFGIPWIVEVRIAGRRIRRGALPAATAPYPANPVGEDRRAAPEHATYSTARR
jgi:hypothetical protein